MSNFMAQGGFGFYVWMAYGAVFLLLLIEVLVLRHQHRQLITQLKRRFRDRQ